MLIPKLRQIAPAEYVFSLAPPRGLLSGIALLVSGVFAFVLTFFTLVSWGLDGEAVPTFMLVMTVIVTLVFLVIFYDRREAQKKGVHIHFSTSQAKKRYRVLHHTQKIEENPLDADRFKIAVMTLPGAAGRVIVPTYVLLFKVDAIVEGYRSETSEGPGYTLFHFTERDKLIAQVESFCHTLGIDVPE